MIIDRLHFIRQTKTAASTPALFPPARALTLPPQFIARFRDAYPNVDLVTSILPTNLSTEQLVKRAVDAVVAGPLALEGCAYEPLFTSRLILVFSTSAFTAHELQRMNPAGPERALTAGIDALAGKTVLGVSPSNHVERSLTPYLARACPSARLSYDFGDTMLAQNAMEQGIGGAIVEESAARKLFDRTGFVLVPLADGAPTWEVGVTYFADGANVNAVRNFIAFAAALVQEAATA